MYNIGDYVLYQNGNSLGLGRVYRKVNDTTYAVCYNSGCTAARTPASLLKPLTNSSVIGNSSLGYHRFDSSCPDYNPDICFDCQCKSEHE